MIHAPIKILGKIASDLFPGSEVFTINSKEPMCVVTVFENAVLFNNSKLMLSFRPVRFLYNQVNSFYLNWDRFVDSEYLDFDTLPKVDKVFEPGIMVVDCKPKINRAYVKVLVRENQNGGYWVTDKGSKIYFEDKDYLIPSGCFLDSS